MLELERHRNESKEHGVLNARTPSQDAPHTLHASAGTQAVCMGYIECRHTLMQLFGPFLGLRCVFLYAENDFTN